MSGFATISGMAFTVRACIVITRVFSGADEGSSNLSKWIGNEDPSITEFELKEIVAFSFRKKGWPKIPSCGIGNESGTK